MDKLLAMHNFVRVVETGSFSAVAHEGNTTQATISKRVAALEAALGVKLLIRSSRQQSLTEAGEGYYRHCLTILEAVDEAESTARSQTNNPQGLLRVTAPVDFATDILLPLFQQFMKEYPEIRLDLVLDNYRLDLVAAGIDVAIRADSMPDSTLIARYLCNNPLVLVASPGYLETYGIPEQPSDIKGHECILYSGFDNPTQWSFIKSEKKTTVTVSGQLISNNGAIQKTMLLAGKGLSIVPYWLVHEELANKKLLRVMKDYQHMTLPLNLVYPDKKYLPLKTRTFIDFMLSQAKSHPAFSE